MIHISLSRVSRVIHKLNLSRVSSRHDTYKLVRHSADRLHAIPTACMASRSWGADRRILCSPPGCVEFSMCQAKVAAQQLLACKYNSITCMKALHAGHCRLLSRGPASIGACTLGPRAARPCDGTAWHCPLTVTVLSVDGSCMRSGRPCMRRARPAPPRAQRSAEPRSFPLALSSLDSTAAEPRL